MKRTRHKILSVFLSVCMIISCMVGMSVSALAAEMQWDSDNAIYTLTGGVCNTTYGTSSGLGYYQIPLEDQKVLAITTINVWVKITGNPTWGLIQVCKNDNNLIKQSNFSNFKKGIHKYTFDYEQGTSAEGSGIYAQVLLGGEDNEKYGELLAYEISFSDSLETVKAGGLNYPEFDIPNALTATVGQTLAAVALPTSTNGTWSWADSTTSVGEEGTHTFNATFTPTDNTLHTLTNIAVPVTVNAASTTPTVTITPTGAGTVDLAWDSDYPQDLIFTAAANSGYEFDHWSYNNNNNINNEWEEETSTLNPFTLGYYREYKENYKDFTAHFKATTVVASDIDISNGTVTVSTSAKTVTVTVDGNTVPADAYHIIYFTYEKIEGGETLNRVGTDFPTTAGTYIAAVVANENSGYTGENRSEPFTVSSGSGYTPVAPSYTPTTTTTTTNTGKLDNTTDEKKNDNGASLESSNDELSKAVLTDADRAAMANGEDVQVYLEVEEKEPTKADQQKAEEALAEIDADGEIVMYMDMNLFKKVGSSSPVQIHKVGDKVEVGFKVPEKFVSNDPDVQRTFYIGHIKDDGTVEIIKCEFDPETGIATFLTDSFSCFFLIFKDAPASADTSVEETDSGTDNGKEINVSDNTDNQVDHADETNPHTGVAFGGIAVLITAGAAMIVSKKRRK